MTKKVCTSCGKKKSVDEGFYRCSGRILAECKGCHNLRMAEYIRQREKRDPKFRETRRENQRKRRAERRAGLR